MAGFGLKPVRKLDGGELRVRAYVAAATNASTLLVGDAVELEGGIDVATGLPTIKIGVAGDALLGAIVGFEGGNASAPLTQHRVASTRRVVLVCDDPDAVFQIQEDADGGSVSAANVGSGANGDIVITAGSTTTGLSGHTFNSSEASASAAQLKIVGMLRDDVNAAASSAVLEVIIHEHALRTADSIT